MNRLNRIIPLVILACGATPALAQSPVLDPGTRNALWLQVQHPNQFYGFSTGSAFLVDVGALLDVGADIRLLFDLPVVRADIAGGNTVVGNPLVGIREPLGNGYFELTGRIPLVGNTAGPAVAAAVADFDHVEAYFSDVVTVGALFSAATDAPDAQGFVGRFRAGASAWVPTHGGNSQLMADYGGTLSFRLERTELAAGLTGRMFLNNTQGMSISERTLHQAVFGLTLHVARIRPTLFFRIPVDDNAKHMYNSVIGVGAVMDLR